MHLFSAHFLIFLYFRPRQTSNLQENLFNKSVHETMLIILTESRKVRDLIMKTKFQEQTILQGGSNLFNRITHGTKAEHLLDEDHFNENQYCGKWQPPTE